jgi:hypothetical protein
MRTGMRWAAMVAFVVGSATLAFAKCDSTGADAGDIANARAAIAANCDCAGSATHGSFVRCAASPGEDHADQQELQRGRREVRRALHLRQERLRLLLSDERQGRDEVQDEEERHGVQGAEGRRGVREHAVQLLRRVHGNRLYVVSERCVPPALSAT